MVLDFDFGFDAFPCAAFFFTSAFISAISLETDPHFSRLQIASISLFCAFVESTPSASARNFSEQLDYPKGDPRNPLSDAEIEEKFRALAEGVLSAKAQDKLIDAIWNLEKCASVTKLMALMKADVKKKAKAKAIKKRR